MIQHAVLGRRRFLGRSLGYAGAGLVTALTPQLRASVRTAVVRRRGASAEAVARDEDFWRPIQQAYDVDRSQLNLNNGGVSPSPWKVHQTHRRLTDFANQAPAYNMWKILEPQKETVRRQLAGLFGADPEEIAICRNATEALETITFGLCLAPGDEVLSTDQDYPRMVAAWKQRALRDGIRFTQISLPPPEASTEQIVAAFERARTPRTRVLHFSHVVFLTGRILPVRELCAWARRHGIQSLVDGAHAFGHIPFTQEELGCDYYGTSLHKWLSAPIGTGMMFVSREHIGPLWPLFAAEEPEATDIRKLEQIGTHPCPLFLAISEAVHFQELIGTERKTARLRYLREQWLEKVRDEPNARLHTPLPEGRSGGFATVEIEGLDPQELTRHLHDCHHVHVAAIRHRDFRGIRVSPHVYTTVSEARRFGQVLQEIARRGLPG